MNNQTLYPYSYNLGDFKDDYDSLPVGLSNKLMSNLNELSLFRYLKKFSASESTISRNQKILRESLVDTARELVNIVRFGGEDLDLPAAVSSRTLYAIARNQDLKFCDKLSVEEDDLNKLISNFTKKLKYADGESIANVLYSLAALQNFDKTLWSSLLEELSTKAFQPEFTQVSNKAPFLFRYYENDVDKNKYVNKMGYTLYFQGNILRLNIKS
ncbi:MAG: hypothetical protein GY853_06930 [PVC group bacterium]|nr:hypothetical protein [PVC group bacterium]